MSQNQKRLLRINQVLEILPIGKSTFWAGIKSGKYPKGLKLGGKTTVWLASDIQDVIDSLKKEGQ